MESTAPSSLRPPKSVMEKIGDVLAKAVGAVLIALIAVIVVVIFAQVFWRYVLSAPLLWPEEGARYCFIWVCFLGLPLLLRQRELIAVDALVRLLPMRVAAVLPLVCLLLAVPLLVVLVWKGAAMIALVAGQVAPATRIPAGWLYLAAPVGGALSLFYVLEGLSGRKAPETGEGTAV